MSENNSVDAAASPLLSAAEAIEVACAALNDWADDLAATRDQYIDAHSSGSFNGRRIAPKMARAFAHDFGERSSAVAGCVDIVRAAIAKTGR